VALWLFYLFRQVSATVDKFLHDFEALGLCDESGLLYFLVGRDLGYIFATEVGDDRYAVDTHSCMVCDNDFRDC